MHLSRHPRRFCLFLRAHATSPRLRWLVGAAVVAGLAATILGRDDVVRAWRAFLAADLRWVAVALALAFALGLQALQLAVAIVAGLVALGAQNLTLADLSARSREAAAAMRRAETGLQAAEDPAGS